MAGPSRRHREIDPRRINRPSREWRFDCQARNVLPPVAVQRVSGHCLPHGGWLPFTNTNADASDEPGSHCQTTLPHGHARAWPCSAPGWSTVGHAGLENPPRRRPVQLARRQMGGEFCRGGGVAAVLLLLINRLLSCAPSSLSVASTK